MTRFVRLSLAAICLGLGFVAGPLFSNDDDSKGPDQGIFDQTAIVKDEQPAAQEGVEPLGKGVVHEAFATPTTFTAQAGQPVAKEPPAAIEEMPPEQKPDGDNVQWINGYFAWDEERTDFYWISGLWRNIPPHMEWVPGTWAAAGNGWQYQSGFWKHVSAGDLQVVPMPPEPLNTIDPPAPGADHSYVPGCWVYRESRYVWRPACWTPYRVGWVWVPARYVSTRCGWTFIEGYWDYTLRERGLLFCPVYITRTYHTRPNWVYRPSYVVHDHCLLSCLFVHRRSGCYHFGNYYDNTYVQGGYTPWTTYRVNRYHDPLFAHYRHVNRHDPRWETNLVNLQIGRIKGTTPRPPENLLLQAKLAKNNAANVNQFVLLAPITRVNKQVMPLKKLNADQVKVHFQSAQKQKEASVLRAKNEDKIAKAAGTMKLGDQPRNVKLDLPKITQTTVLTDRIKTLPPGPQGHKGQTPIGTIGDKTNPKDKGTTTTPPKDKGTTTTPPKDKGTTTTPPKDKGTEVTPPKDKGTTTPPKDKGTTTTPPKDKGTTTPPKDKGTEVTPPKDKGTTTPPKDKGTTTTPPKDKGTTTTPPKDKGTEVAPPKDKGTTITPPKDKGTTTTTPPKDKGTTTPPKGPVIKGKTSLEVRPANEAGATQRAELTVNRRDLDRLTDRRLDVAITTKR